MTPPALADRIAEAAQAEAEPRARVQQLAAALDTAVAAQQYDDAERIRHQLQDAREALALAEATTTALRQGAQAVEAERVATVQKIAAAQDRDRATADLNQGVVAQARGREQLEAALSALFDTIADAQRRYQTAQAFEQQVNRAAVSIIDARRRLGEWPADHPGPTAAKVNRTQVLAAQDPLIKALVNWRRP